MAVKIDKPTGKLAVLLLEQGFTLFMNGDLLQVVDRGRKIGPISVAVPAIPNHTASTFVTAIKRRFDEIEAEIINKQAEDASHGKATQTTDEPH
jgi:hypothetical protein